MYYVFIYVFYYYVCIVHGILGRAGFKGKRSSSRPRGLHKKEIGSTYFIAIFSSVKSRYFDWYIILVVIRNTDKNKN
jgi:hypothetical protein